jgi:uncharacterized protein (TIGR00369 family)
MMKELQGRTFGVTPPEEIVRLTGFEFLDGMRSGRLPLPPIMERLNYLFTVVEPGRVVMEGEPLEAFLNPIGTIHGGWHATLLDSVMACAIQTTFPAGKTYTTVEMKLNYVRGVLPTTGRVIAEGRVVHPGNRIATSEGKLLSTEGKLLAHGTETCAIF